MKEMCCPHCKRCIKVHSGVKEATHQCNPNSKRVWQMKRRETPQ